MPGRRVGVRGFLLSPRSASEVQRRKAYEGLESDDVPASIPVMRLVTHTKISHMARTHITA
jgi:hypothetical protein